MKLISQQQIRALNISPTQCIEWVKESFSLKEKAQLPAKVSLHPQGNDFFNTMPCLLPAPYNYFGVKDDFCNKLITIVPNLILDCTQSYFYIPRNVDAFFSVRKFFGVPDGGFCYLKKSEKIELEDSISYDNCVHLLKRIDCNANSGYQDFQLNNKKMHKWHPQKMSKLTKAILHSIDINRCKCQRSKNFNKLHLSLGTSNLLRIPELNETPPMVYPFLSDKTMELRHKLIENNIFIAKYWPNIKTEFSLEDKILPLVIDQRYTEIDMDFVLEVMSNEF
jgi:hypothetical protein